MSDTHQREIISSTQIAGGIRRHTVERRSYEDVRDVMVEVAPDGASVLLFEKPQDGKFGSWSSLTFTPAEARIIAAEMTRVADLAEASASRAGKWMGA